MDCLQEQRKDKLRKLINECELDNPYEILYEEVRKKITEINFRAYFQGLKYDSWKNLVSIYVNNFNLLKIIEKEEKALKKKH